MNIEERIACWKERFKDHIMEPPTQDGFILFRKPGTMIDSIYYKTFKGYLIVTGDLGDAIYQWWGSDISLEWIAGCGLFYFESKCKASERGSYFREWDGDVAKNRLIDLGHTDPTLLDAADDSEEEFARFCERDDGLTLGEDWWEMLDIGMVPANRCVAHLAGLKVMFQVE